MNRYRTVNLVLLGFLLYSLVFPLVSPYMERIAPAVWRCHYRALTGRPCPFCGLTGDMRVFLSGGGIDNPSNSRFPTLLKLYAAELVLRIFFTAGSFRWNGLYRFDAVVHLAWLVILIF
jgi:hypothetical protein